MMIHEYDKLPQAYQLWYANPQHIPSKRFSAEVEFILVFFAPLALATVS